MMGQEASTLAREYGPQWMNMPNLACLNQAVRCASASPLAGGVAACWALLTEEKPKRKVHAVRVRRQPESPDSGYLPYVRSLWRGALKGSPTRP